LKHAATGRLSADIPYLGYARKDRRPSSRDPITTKDVAQMIEEYGAGAVAGFDVHNLAHSRMRFGNLIAATPDGSARRRVSVDGRSWQPIGEISHHRQCNGVRTSGVGARRP
jgi:hypothetical protein